MQETPEMQFPSLGQEDPLEEGMATHSSTLAWKIPWTEEPGGLQPLGSQTTRHTWSFLACTPAQVKDRTRIPNLGSHKGLAGEGNGTPLQYSCLENPMDGGAWWAAVHGVAKSRTRLNDFSFTFHFHALEKEMAAHSNVLAWRIVGMAEPGGLPSMGSHRVGHDWSNLAEAAAARD